jgi:hypothetical protein
MSPTLTTTITCSTADILPSELRSVSRCSESTSAASGEAALDREFSCVNTG